jgi:hypothetical protein
MKRMILMTAALALVPLTAHAQHAGQAEARMSAAIETAVQAGIPAALVQSKIAEGRAKGVAAERIAAAVELRLDALLRAKSAMQRAQLESTTAADLSIAADAVQAGVSETALVEISRTAPQERRALAIAVLANLVALGHGSEHALADVRVALGRGPDALVNLQAQTATELGARGAVGLDVAGASAGAAGGVRIDLGLRPNGGG